MVMKNIFKIFFISCIALQTGWAQVEFQRSFGGMKKENSYQVLQTSDKGYFSLGSTESFGLGKSDIYLIKMDSMGNLKWSKTYGGAGNDYGHSMVKAKDGSYAILGHGSSFSKDYNDLCLIKINEEGTVLWSKAYGLDASDYSNSIEVTSDGGFIILAETINFIGNDKNSDILVIKVNSEGIIQWSKVFGGNGTDYAYSIQQTKEGGFVIGGETNSYGVGEWDYYMLKLKADGAVEWSKTYGESGIDFGRYAQQTPDGGYIIGGNTVNYKADGFDVCLIKVNSTGEIEWTKVYGGSGTDYLLSLKLIGEKGFVVVGYTNSADFSSEDVLVMKFNFSGNIQWTKSFGSNMNDYGVALTVISDDEIIIGGSTKGFGTMDDDVYIIKTTLKFITKPCNQNSFFPLTKKKAVVKIGKGHYDYDLHSDERKIEMGVSSPVTAEQVLCPDLLY
jgi:hypothetical protein